MEKKKETQDKKTKVLQPQPWTVIRKRRCWIMDHFLSSEECKEWIKQSESVGYKQITYQEKFRNCSRVFFFNEDLAQQLWKKIAGLVPATVCDEEQKTWYAKRLNPNIRFCRYYPGEYIAKHCDENIWIEKEKSFYTIMIYLNDLNLGDVSDVGSSTGSAIGGSTRFYTENSFAEEILDFEIVPREGRMILFWQQGMLHDGQSITAGIKYIMRTEIMYRPSLK